MSYKFPFEHTVAYQARYGDIIAESFPNCDVIWEESEADYQGSCSVILEMENKTFAHVEWSYGSCSGCDDWENRNLNDDQIRAEVLQSHTAYFDNLKTLQNYVLDLKSYRAITPATALVQWLERKEKA